MKLRKKINNFINNGILKPVANKLKPPRFFEKEEWLNQRSLAFRLWLNHPEKTLEKEEIEAVRQCAIKASEKLGAKLR